MWSNCNTYQSLQSLYIMSLGNFIASNSHFTFKTQKVQLKECELVFMQNGNLLFYYPHYTVLLPNNFN